MVGWIGWDFAGAVAHVDDESIATHFFHVIVPVWPGATYYRTGAGEFAIARSRQSVILGLVRTPLWLLATLLAAPALLDHALWLALLPLALLVGGIAALLTFGAGSLPPAERERRALLKRVTGLGAPPELLPDDVLVQRREQLVDAWFEEFHSDWRLAITRQRLGAEVLVALAEYHGEAKLVRRARENLIDALGN